MTKTERAVAAEIKRVGLGGASALGLARAAIRAYEKAKADLAGFPDRCRGCGACKKPS